MREPKSIISWQDLVTKTYDDQEFLIEPFLPREGIVLLWGKSSIGKSPLVWTMAQCVGTGQSFLGLPTEKGKVLFIELDSPERSVVSRLKKLPTWSPAPEAGVDFLFLSPLSVPVLAVGDMASLNAAAERGYDLVIVNTLRKTHSLNDKESQTPALVYGFYKRLFPSSTILFVHHSKKSQLNQTSGSYEAGLEGESFSGAQNWINDAQVGIHLREFKNSRMGTTLNLRHEKAQVSDKYASMALRLAYDNTIVECPEAEMVQKVREFLSQSDASKGYLLDDQISRMLSCGLTKARELREAAGKKVWMKRKGDSVEGEE